jgi:tetratricopeptide (TPR) repeat protein
VTTDPGEIRQILADYQRTSDPARLGEVVDGVRLLAGRPGFAGLDGSARAFLWTLGAAALSWRARGPLARPTDLDQAIEWSQNAVDAWPEGSVELARSRSNLATVLTDRYERDADPRDLTRAIPLYEAAIRDMRAAGDRLDVALHSYGCCLHSHATAAGGGGVADLDRAIELFVEALDSPGPEGEERAGYLNSLGLSLRAKGRALADRDLLADASAAYREARGLGRPGGESHVAASINLGVVLQDLAEADNDVAALREAVAVYREVHRFLAPDDERRHVLVTTNLCTGLIDLFRYTRDLRLLEDATRELRANVERAAEGPVRQTVLANLAAALHEIFDYTGRLALLDEAVAVQERLVAVPAAALPERQLNLGVSLLARFRRRRARADLDRAVALFGDAARLTTSAIDRASALNSQANALSLGFDDSRLRADIDRCVSLRDQAIRTAPAGSLDRALYRANLGVDLLKRYELDGDEADLRRAVHSQRSAARTVPAGSSEQPRLLVGLADSLAREADRVARDRDVASARAAYRRAIGLGRESLPEQALAGAMRWGAWEAGHGWWATAAEAYEQGLAALRRLVADQDLRGDKESWLADAQGLPAAAGDACVRAGDLRRAVTMLEDGRAVLLAESLARRDRITSIRPVASSP